MEEQSLLVAALLGILEGLTEFIPVSSTGHLLLAGHFLGFESTGRSFEVLIQLGAIMAILTVYSARLWHLAVTLPKHRETQRFVGGILLAFLPAAVIGALAHDFIKTVLFETPMVICVMLILGGVVLLWIDRRHVEPEYTHVAEFPLTVCLKIGFIQCLAMIPGTSRSGATIVGALLMGADKRSAAEFSFFLAMPTMVGAFAYDLYKNRDILTVDDFWLIGAGFVTAFIAGVFVVRYLLDFVAKRGYTPFAIWRILVGTIGLAALLAFG
ncbi:MAG: undecaprenyl-diphosphate phosphatase [Aliihoeflea sp.]|uniref:undecaprenyl-diphosphate phosphatase n=1 Tax=Aliihoeflea sp. TaxID=2608088 RepID=UPI004034BD8B